MESLWFIIKEISVPLSAIGTLLMSWCIYRLKNKASKKELYFGHIIDLYYKLENDFDIIYKQNNSNKELNENDSVIREDCLRHIEVNCTLMNYYILRIPGLYKERINFSIILRHLSHNPQDCTEYKKLSEKLKELCWELRDNNKNVHGYFKEYDGKPLIE